MAFSEFEVFRYSKIIEQFIKTEGPRQEVSHQLQWKHILTPKKQSVELFEVRPQFMDKSKIIEIPFAKITYVKSTKVWKIYWMRANGNWISYEPEPEAITLAEALRIIREDSYFCFFG